MDLIERGSIEKIAKLNRKTDAANRKLVEVRKQHKDAVRRRKEHLHVIHRLQRVNLFHEKTAVQLIQERDEKRA
jgi:hypothetical protein